MVALISHPFRFTGNGRIATVEQGTDEAAAEQIAMLLLIRTGERPLCPEFGVTDMVGQGLDASELEAAVATFGPDVDLRDIEITSVTETTQQVSVTFE
jgi:hypothetical protein